MLWYTQLQPRSIGSFDELALSFKSQFVASNRQPKSIDALTNLWQEPDESVKYFFEHYYNVYNLVDGYN